MLYQQQTHRRIASGFTLIEILIVVVILAIVASIGVVAFGSASREAREAVLLEELRYMRSQLALYRATHSRAAGLNAEGAASWETMQAQLTKYTDFHGNVSNTRNEQFSFAPYLSEFPRNPFIATDAEVAKFVQPSEVDSEPDESTGWIYCPETLEFYANSKVYGRTGKKW